jgi:GNAT superfamily N-acetyltransferase
MSGAKMAINVREMHFEEITPVADMVVRTFMHDVAPAYGQEGVREFLKYAQINAFELRFQNNHFVLVAESEGQLVGMIEMRNHDHVSLFFVDPQHQRQGIGRELFQRAVDLCRAARPGILHITVNSSPNAVKAYEDFGFHATSAMKEINGIKFVPMEVEIS